MNEDLKEIIEHVNETNKRQDPNDPVSLFFLQYFKKSFKLICMYLTK